LQYFLIQFFLVGLEAFKNPRLDFKNLEQFILGLRSGSNTPFNSGPLLIAPFGFQFELTTREKTIEEIREHLTSHLVSLKNNAFGRKDHPIPVCAGSPGIGKVI
jgi:hypothetical protein